MTGQQPPRRRWFQFSLRSLLITTTVVGAGMGWFMSTIYHAREQEQAVKAIREAGGLVSYVSEELGKGENFSDKSFHGPQWLKGWLPDDMFHEPLLVAGQPLLTYKSQDLDKLLAAASRLKSLKTLDLSDLPITDDQLQTISKLHQLKRLNLRRTKVTEAGFVHLTGLKKLEHLELSCRFNPKGEQSLQELEQLLSHPAVGETVLLFCREVSRGLFPFDGRPFGQAYPFESQYERFRSLAEEQNFASADGPLTRPERELLARMRELLDFALINRTISTSGIDNLRAALPNCKIVLITIVDRPPRPSRLW